MTRIKICGITNREDAKAAVELGADALGFIFVPESPRFVGGMAGIIDLVRDIPAFVTRVGVCVTADAIDPEVRRHLDLFQVYDHTVAPPQSVMPAFRIRDEGDLAAVEAAVSFMHPRAILLDAFSESSLGGAGASFDWTIAAIARGRFCTPLVLAGGLNASNAAVAVRTVRPYAVDASSGLELSPGRKDHARMREFIEAVRAEE